MVAVQSSANGKDSHTGLLGFKREPAMISSGSCDILGEWPFLCPETPNSVKKGQ